MSDRHEIYFMARELAQKITESTEINRLRMAEAHMEDFGERKSEDYEMARKAAESLLKQVMTIIMHPITGEAELGQKAAGGCSGCGTH